MFSSQNSQVSSAANYIEDVFSTYLYTGNGTLGRTITNGIDLSTKGGLVWIKSRSTNDGNGLFDTVRGISHGLGSDSTGAQNNYGLDSVTTSGFVTSLTDAGWYGQNLNATNLVSWTFRKQPKFFDVVTWTGTGGLNRTISHSLGSVPGCVIIKRTDSAEAWWVYHRGATSPNANWWQNFFMLNTTDAAQSDLTSFGQPTSTTLTLDPTGAFYNNSGKQYVAYIFAHNAGGFGLTGTDNVISCGSYTGNNGSPQKVELGFEPQWLLVKNATLGTAGAWWSVVDLMRGMSVSGNTINLLKANTSGAEISENAFSPYATGFNVSNNNDFQNNSNNTYIYIAIRRGPMKVPTDGTKVLAMDTQSSFSANELVDSTFPPDMFIAKARSSGSTWNSSRLTGGYLDMSATSAEVAGTWKFDGAGGEIYATSIYNGAPIYWQLRRAPGFHDEVCYTGNNTNSRAINHNLGVAPEMIIIKQRTTGGYSTENWVTWTPAIATDSMLLLNTTDAVISYYYSWSTTATTFTPATDYTYYNVTGQNYVAYLFASCPGVSKVGSYTGTGTTQQINCGFAAGARFVLIKRTDSTGDWYVWDTARGIVSGNDPYLLLNSTAAEVTTTDYIDAYSSGFEISSTAPAAINASGGTFIYLAIA